jgi:tryptophanase
MVKKQIQSHDFLNDGPVRQYEIPFVYDGINIVEGTFLIGVDPIGFQTESIFSVSEEGVYYQNQPLVTENRLREVVREMMDQYFIPVRSSD